MYRTAEAQLQSANARLEQPPRCATNAANQRHFFTQQQARHPHLEQLPQRLDQLKLQVLRQAAHLQGGARMGKHNVANLKAAGLLSLAPAADSTVLLPCQAQAPRPPAPPHIVVALDGVAVLLALSRGRARLNDIRVEGALHSR